MGPLGLSVLSSLWHIFSFPSFHPLRDHLSTGSATILPALTHIHTKTPPAYFPTAPYNLCKPLSPQRLYTTYFHYSLLHCGWPHLPGTSFISITPSPLVPLTAALRVSSWEQKRWYSADGVMPLLVGISGHMSGQPARQRVGQTSTVCPAR